MPVATSGHGWSSSSPASVDAEWCQPRERGFSWWPGRRAHVWAEPPYEDDGSRARVHVRTDLLRSVPDGDGLAPAPVMQAADLSGLVWSGTRGPSVREQLSSTNRWRRAWGSLSSWRPPFRRPRPRAGGGLPSRRRAQRVRARPACAVGRTRCSTSSKIRSRQGRPSVFPALITQAVEGSANRAFLERQRDRVRDRVPFALTSLLTMKTDDPHAPREWVEYPTRPTADDRRGGPAETVRVALNLNTSEANLHTDTHFASWYPARGGSHPRSRRTSSAAGPGRC